MRSHDIRFHRYYVTNGTIRARVFYSLDNRIDGRACVTIYARDYSRALGAIFADDYQNDTDSQTDYFDEGRVVLFADHPLYQTARARVIAHHAAHDAKQQAQAAIMDRIAEDARG